MTVAGIAVIEANGKVFSQPHNWVFLTFDLGVVPEALLFVEARIEIMTEGGSTNGARVNVNGVIVGHIDPSRYGLNIINQQTFAMTPTILNNTVSGGPHQSNSVSILPPPGRRVDLRKMWLLYGKSRT